MLPAYLCTNCGFWQKRFGVPTTCPVCTDFRHTPPDGGFEFWSLAETAQAVQTVWTGEDADIATFSTRPRIGIGPQGYLIRRADGNIFFDGTAHYTADALALIEARGGIRWLSASHPHAYGALWQLQERFKPQVAIGVPDLPWTSAFSTTWPFDEQLALGPGATLLRTGGHFAGHAVLWLADRKTLFAGDMVKLHWDNGTEQPPTGISTHKGFNRRIPMSHGEIKHYRSVVAALDFSTVYTTFDHATCTRTDVLRLFDAQLAGPPFVQPVPLGNPV